MRADDEHRRCAEQTSIIGQGWGLDHFQIAVASYDQVREVFATKLGFTVPEASKFPAQGAANAILSLEPAYIEFLWFYDRPKVPFGTGRLDRAVSSGGGPFHYNLDVSPAEGAATLLLAAGAKARTAPGQNVRHPDGSEEPGLWTTIIVDPGQTRVLAHAPGGSEVGLIEYRNNVAAARQQNRERLPHGVQPDPRRLPGEWHANTARRLHSVWVAVENVDAAVKQSGRFGLAAVGPERNDAALGARGREVLCGSGTIIFWEPSKSDGVVAALLSKKGPGPFGISVDVADLKRAHDLVEQGVGTKLPIVKNGDRQSFVVPGALAANTWVEFAQ